MLTKIISEKKFEIIKNFNKKNKELFDGIVEKLVQYKKISEECLKFKETLISRRDKYEVPVLENEELHLSFKLRKEELVTDNFNMKLLSKDIEIMSMFKGK